MPVCSTLTRRHRPSNERLLTGQRAFAVSQSDKLYVMQWKSLREGEMPSALYVCLQDEDKVVAFGLEDRTGQLTRQAEVPAAGGPSVLAISPDRRVLYAGHRAVPAISSFRIDYGTGALTPQRTVPAEHAPTFLATDRTGRFCSPHTTKAGMPRSTRSARTDRWALHPSTGWIRPPAPMLSRPIARTGLPSCRILLASTTMSWSRCARTTA